MYDHDNNNPIIEPGITRDPSSPTAGAIMPDPIEAHIFPTKPPKKRWFFKLTVFVLILTFVSGFTFGAGYLTASYYGSALPNPYKTATIENLSNKDQASITQVKSVITTKSSSGSTIATIAGEVSPAIVTIASYSDQQSNDIFGNSKGFYGGTGSGIVFRAQDEELLIVTNYHVIEGAANIDIIFHDGEKIKAKTLGYNSRMDLAVLSVPLATVKDHLDEVVIASFGDSEAVQVGDLAIAIGNPLGPEYALTVTAGIISALGREINIDQNTTQVNLIQTDAAINPGNSGGALLNNQGEVVGINSAKYVAESVEGIGFAIPINDAITSIEEILKSRNGSDLAYELSEDRAFLGVGIKNVDAQINAETGMTFGVYITEVYPGSGAKEAGILVGDIIYGIEGNRIRNVQGLFNVLDSATIGDVITIELVRDDALIEVEAPLYSYKEVMSQQ